VSHFKVFFLKLNLSLINTVIIIKVVHFYYIKPNVIYKFGLKLYLYEMSITDAEIVMSRKINWY